MAFNLILFLTNRIYPSYHFADCKTIPNVVHGMAKPAADMVRITTYSHHHYSMADKNQDMSDREEGKGDTETEDNGVETEDGEELLKGKD